MGAGGRHPWVSFPLDGGAGFGREVVENTVDSLDLCQDALSDLVEEGPGDLFHRGGHGILSVDCTDDDGPIPETLSVLNSGGAIVGDDGEVLPYFALESRFGELLAEDRIGFADSLETVSCDCACTADTESGSGEGLAVHHVIGQTKLFTDHTYLILEQKLDWFHKFESELLGKSADVVVGLDTVALEDIGVDGTLSEEFDSLDLLGFLLEDCDELGTDDLPLLLRVRDPCKFVEEAVCGIHIYEVCLHLVPEDVDDLLGLSLTEETVIYVNACEVLSDGFDEKCSHYGGVYTAGEGQKDLSVTDLLL